jgi:hypothetical protein
MKIIRYKNIFIYILGFIIIFILNYKNIVQATLINQYEMEQKYLLKNSELFIEDYGFKDKMIGTKILMDLKKIKGSNLQPLKVVNKSLLIIIPTNTNSLAV